MTRLIATRVAQSLLVALSVAFIAFALSEFVGDPVQNMLGPEATLEERAQVSAQLGLDRPFPLRFTRYLLQLADGNFGRSYRTGEPVLAMIAERLPATIELAGVAFILTLAIGIPVGVYCGLYPQKLLTKSSLYVTLVGVSMPTFLTGVLLILVFSVFLGWFPAFGRGETTAVGAWTTGLLTDSGRRALVLPALTLSLFPTTLVVRLVRAEISEVMQTDFIRFCAARGLSLRLLHYRHALRNSLMPVLTMLGLQFGYIIAFALITETVFSWPGVGQLMVQSVQFADIPVMASYLTLTGFLFVAINLAVDISYVFVDPRLRASITGGA
jgi:peptide/nickel transport system permease protein